MNVISAEEKRRALERVLASRVFEKSGRARDLLAYIVEQDLAGNADAIKGFSVAVDVFGKDESFDAASDPLVRVQAGRLRDYLREYYAGEGENDQVVIAVPLGGYKPAYEHAAKSAITSEPANTAVMDAVPDAGETAERLATVAPGSGRTVTGDDVATVFAPAKIRAVPGQPPGRSTPRLRRQFRLVWAALAALFILIACFGWYLYQSLPAGLALHGDDTRAVSEAPANPLPALSVFHDGTVSQVMISAKQLSEIISKFDMVVTTAMAPASAIDSGPWGPRDYGVRLSLTPQLDVDGPKQVRFELLHLMSRTVLRTETYPADIWASPDLALIAASKLNTIANPGGLLFADMASRGTQSPVAECLQLVRQYYDRRVADTHRPAYECTERLKNAPFAGGILLASHGGLVAEAAGKGFSYADLPAERGAALNLALEQALAGVDLAPSSARAAREVGFVLSWRGEMSSMQEWFERAYELNPFDTSVAASNGYGLVLAGKFEQAIPVLHAAIEASTRHPTWWDFYYSLALLMEERIADAKRAAEPLAASEKNLFYLVLNAVIAFESGNKHLAAKTVRAIQERFPEFSTNPESRIAERHLPEELSQRLIAALRSSGL